MGRLRIILVEPDDVEGLYPFSLTHGAWDIRVGYFTVLERWKQAIPECSIAVHSTRAHILALEKSDADSGLAFADGPTLLVTASYVSSPLVMRRMVDACHGATAPTHFLVDAQTAAVYVPEGGSTIEETIATIDAVDGNSVETIHVAGHIVTRMWQTLDLLHEAVTWDAELLGSNRVHSTANIHAMSVLDESHGPVIIGANAEISPFSVISGPCSIGSGSIVKPHARIAHTVLGPECRIAGEVTHTVFQGFGNKQHEGFVGHSYFGEWVNLGAGTTTSNLKTTYSNIRVTMPWGREDSHRMFLGTLMGDFSRTSIGTMLSTGTVVGSTAALFAGSTIKACIRSFTWGSERYEFDHALSTAEVVMARRRVELTPALRSVLRIVHDDDR